MRQGGGGKVPEIPMSFEEGRCGVQGCGEGRGPDLGGASARLKKSHSLKPADAGGHTGTLVERNQVGAAAKQNMLAVVDHFPGARMLVGGSAAAQIRTALKQCHAEARGSEGGSGGQAC